MASAPAAMASETVSLLALATSQVFTTLKLLDYFGTVIFAIAGTLTAVENKMDIVGCVILVCALFVSRCTRRGYAPFATSNIACCQAGNTCTYQGCHYQYPIEY